MIQIAIDKKAEKPLYCQIRDQLEEAIRSGALKAGDKLPAVSALAKEIGVTQATIRRALEDLSKAGRTRCHVGRGTFIEGDGSPVEVATGTGARGADHPGAGGDIPAPLGRRSVNADIKHAAQRLKRGIHKGLKDLLSLSCKSGHIHFRFASGIPDHRQGYDDLFRRAVEETVRDNALRYIEHGDCQGLVELRSEIAGRYRDRGIEVAPEEVLITNGAQQGASIVAQDAFERRLITLCETPCFQGIPETFQVQGNWVETIDRDPEGPQPGQLARYAKSGTCLLYMCPELHNPTGFDISNARMKEVGRWARDSQSVLLGDEIFHDLRFEGTPPVSAIQSAGKKNGIVISSMSKSLLSGLRVGWLVTSAERIQDYVTYKRLMDQACPPMMQGVVLTLLQSGEYDAHLKRIRGLYLERRNLMIECLEQMMPDEVTWSRPDGGFAVWVTLPEGYSSIALLLSAMERGVSFFPGPIFDMDQRFVNCFRLSYAWTDQDQIAEGVEILADTVKELLSSPPGDSGLSGLGNFQ